MRTKLALLALVAALALAGWLILGGQPWRSGAAEPGAAPSGTEAARTNAELDGPTTSPWLEAAGRAEVGAELAAGVEAASSAIDSPIENEALEVVVVDSQSGLFVPGAVIAWVDLGLRPSADGLAARSNLSRLDGLLESSGRRETTDAAGRARIPRFAGAGVVAAEQGSRWGRALADAHTESPLRVALSRDAALLVQVVDGAGAPRAGQPVELCKHTEHGVVTLARAETAGPEGLARLPHAGWALASEPKLNWYAALGGTHRPIVQRQLDPGALPATPIRLVLPGQGEVEVRVLEPDGVPASGRIQVRLEVAGTSRGQAGRQSAWAVDGRAHFGHVGLGLELAATVSRGLIEDPLPSVKANGPSREGERVSIELRLGVDHPIAIGRLLLPSREPLTSAQIKAEHQVRAGNSVSSRAIEDETDAAGRFRVDLPRPGSFAAQRKLRLTWNGSGAEPPHEVEAELPAELGPGVHDLGDLMLASLPLVASGRVLDERGRPVPSISVEVVVPMRPGVADTHWGPVFRLQTSSGPDGSFELRGTLDTPTIGLVADQRAEHRLEVPLGSRDVELPLFRPGAIEGSILPDPGWRGLEVYARPADRDAPPGAQTSKSTSTTISDDGQRTVSYGDGGKGVRPAPDGGFALKALAPGAWTVELRMQGASTPLLTVEAVMVEAGVVTRDSRLQRIALAALLQRVVLLVRDPEGKPVPGGDVHHRASGAKTEAPWSRLSLEGGRAEILARESELDLRIVAPGFRSAALERVSGEREVVLSLGIPVRLVLAGGAAPPEAPHHLVAQLTRISDGAEPGKSPRRADIGVSGEAIVLLSDPGRWRVAWRLEQRTATTTSSMGFPPKAESTPQEIEVLDSNVEQVFALKLSADALEQAQTALGY